VQNRVAQALARLPEDVRRQGVTTQKQSPVFLMVVHLVSPDGKYDSLYLRNYAPARQGRTGAISGGGRCAAVRRRRLRDAAVAGPRQDRRARPDRRRRAARGARTERAGLGRPARRGADAERQRLPDLPINAKGRLESVAEFGDIVLESGTGGEIVRLRDVARIELGAGDYTLRARLDGKNAVAIGIFQAPGANALQIRDAVVAKMDELRPTLFRRAWNSSRSTTPPSSCAIRSRRW
jgi:multidrug efflux pump